MRWLLLLCCMCTGLSAATLKLATDEWPPFRQLEESGEFSGYDIDLIKELSEASGIDIQVGRYPWKRALQEMQSGRVDLMSGLAYTEERAEYIDYLQPPYHLCRPAFYGLAEAVAGITSYGHLQGKRIGFVIGSAYFPLFDNDTNLKKYGVVTEKQLVGMVEQHKLDLLVGTDCQVDYQIMLSGNTLLKKAAYQPEDSVALYFGVSKAAKLEQRDQLERALQGLIDSGVVHELDLRYFSR